MNQQSKNVRLRYLGTMGSCLALLVGTSTSWAQDAGPNPKVAPPEAPAKEAQREDQPGEKEQGEEGESQSDAEADAAAKSKPEPEAPEGRAQSEEAREGTEAEPGKTREAEVARTTKAPIAGSTAREPKGENDGQADSAASSGEDLSEGLDDVSLVDLLQLDLRVATTKTNTTVAASPAAVTVISREDIERYGYRSVAEALRDVVGTYAVDDHVTPNLGMRGIPGAAFEGSGAVKVMIDGVPVSFRTTGENWLGPALVPMANVERIEVVKGPTSSLYGADAFLGVINVITKKDASKTWGEVGASGMMTYSGGPGTHVEAAGEVVTRPWRFSLSGQFDQEDRSGLAMPSSSPAPTLAETATDQSRVQILRSGVGMLRVSYTPTRQSSVSLVGRSARQYTRAEFAPWLQFTNVPGQSRGTRTSLEQGSVTLKAGSEFTRDFSMEATVTSFFGGTAPDDHIDTGDSIAVVHRELSYYGAEGIVEAIWQPMDPVRLVLGIEGSADREHLGAPDYLSREDGSDIPSAGAAEDFETTLFNVAGRAQITWELVEDYLVPTGGIRFDHNTVYGDKVSGRGALVSQIFEGMHLKAAYGNAFKAPTPLLLYGRPLTVGDVIGSPELGAQELRTLEFTADYRPRSLFDLEVTVSRWDLINRAVFRPEQINLIARNAADAQGWTLEAQAKSRFSDYVGGSLGFEWVNVTRESGEIGYRGDLFGTSPALYPDFIGRGRIWTRPKPWPVEFWTAMNVVGPRNAGDSNTLEAADRYTLPTFVSLDLGLRSVDLNWWDGRLTEISLRGQNVLGTAGDHAGFFGIDYPSAPPKVMLELRQEL